MLEQNPEKNTPEIPRPEIRRGPLRGALGDFDFAIETPSFQSGPQRPGRSWILMGWSLAATAIDGFVVLALTCLFLFVALLMQRLAQTAFIMDRNSLIHLMIPLAIFLYSSYLILMRVFLGNSIGEWACGLRLGEPRQRFSSRYGLLVLARFFIIVATGVIVLPTLSILTGVDWAGRLSGVSLISIR